MQDNSIPGLDKPTTRMILISAGVLLAWSFVCSKIEAGPASASIITYGLYAFYWIYTFRTRNPLVHRLMIFGTIAGILELVTDHYLVAIDQQPGVSWKRTDDLEFACIHAFRVVECIAAVEFYRRAAHEAFQDWCARRFFLCIAGGMYIPTYEHLAKDAGWWWYNLNTPMLFNAPAYVIICEALISLSLPGLLNYSEHHKLGKDGNAGCD